MSPCLPKRHLIFAKSRHLLPLVLIFKIYSSLYINNLVLKNPEASDAPLYNTNRVSLRGSNHANSGVCLVLAKKIQTEYPVGHADAGKWLEPPAKRHEGGTIPLQNCTEK